MTPGEPAGRPVVALLDRLPRGQRGRAAVLGDPDGRWSAALRSRGFEVRSPADPSAPGLEEESQDVIVAAGALERLPWDRWTLQQAHRALANDGVLLVFVPNFHAATSPGDLAFLAGRLLRELVSRTRRALGAAPARSRFRGRRYRRAAFEAMLSSLGFSVEHRSTTGSGWLAPLAGLFPAAVERLGRTHVVVARRLPSLFGTRGRPYPDPAAHRAAFERSHRHYLEDRARWLERHRELRPGPPAALEPADFRERHVLVLAPHPDDELIGCGGTLARLRAAGARITVVHATDGSEAASLWHATGPERATVRLEEAERVAEAMGFEPLVLWREDNASFREREERVRELRERIQTLRPALILVPFVTDVHPDHRTLSRMLARAIRAAAVPEDGRVLSYQVWSKVPANLYCDVTGEMERLERTLLLYETAMKVDDYVHFCQDRNFHDAIELMGRPGFVESYFSVPARAYPELVATAGDADG